MNARALIPILLFALLAHGCGGRPLPGGTSDGATPDAGPVVADGAPASTECLIAIRTDHCCTAPVPALKHHVNKDPCLVPYPATSTSFTKACKARWPKECEVIDCGHARPASRMVRAVPGGGCAWQSECNSDSDCGGAVDATKCCGCGAGYPKSLMAKDVCLHDYNVNHPAPAHCRPKACLGISCKQCPGPPKVSCEAGPKKGINNCMPFSFYQ